MEDEEEVIISLVEVLPRIAVCLGGKEHTSMILECMEMLFTVDNGVIVPKVKNSITRIYNESKEYIKPGLIDFIRKFWVEEGPNAREMALFFYDLIIDTCSEEEVSDIIQIVMSNFKKEERSMKICIVVAVSNQKSCLALKKLNLYKPLTDEVKASVGFNPLMFKVKKLLIEMLKINDPELTQIAFSMLKEINKSNVRTYYKASVLFPVWKNLTEMSEEDQTLYDADFVWKKLRELKVDKDKDDNLDIKDAAFKKEIDIFACMLENLDVEKCLDEFYEVGLEEISYKDGFFMNVYLNNFYTLSEIACKEGEKNKKLKECMLRITMKAIQEKVDQPDKIIEGLKNVLEKFSGVSVFPNIEEFLQSTIDLCLVAEDYKERLQLVEIVIELCTTHPRYSSMLKGKYHKLILDNAFEVRKHACERYIDIVNIDNKLAIDKEYIQAMDLYLSQPSAFKRMTGILLLEILHNLKDRRKDELVMHYIRIFLNDDVSNIRYCTCELLLNMYKMFNTSLSIYSLVDDRYQIETKEDVREVLSSILDICK